MQETMYDDCYQGAGGMQAAASGGLPTEDKFTFKGMHTAPEEAQQ